MNVAGKKCRQLVLFCVGPSVVQHFFGNRFDSLAIRIETPSLRVFLIHSAHHVIKAGAILSSVANKNIETKP